ncbi:MAG: hypothetical protein HZC17_02615 [Candidatus Omnitrophica bacterium]|nr:hypothetical protein [Candidatus Omnitrophota bacterium]
MHKTLIRICSTIVLIVFTFSSICQAAPFAPAQIQILDTTEKNLTNSLLEELPSSIGKIDSSWLIPKFKNPAAGKNPLVIFIQEAHANYPAQKNIALMLAHFQKKLTAAGYKNEIAIGVEGAFSDEEINPVAFRAFPVPKIRRDVSESFLRDAKIDGAEYYAANINSRARIFGIDDRELYQKNLKAARLFFLIQDNFRGELSDIRRHIEKLKQKAYTKPVKDLESSINRLNKDSTTLPLHLALLAQSAKLAKIDLRQYPNVAELFGKIRHLGQHVSEGQIRSLENFHETFDQIKNLEEFIFDRLAKSRDEKTVLRADSILALLEKAGTLSLTKSEFDTLKLKIKTLGDASIWKALDDLLERRGSGFRSQDKIRAVRNLIGPALDFYDSAEKRDRSFGLNIERLMKDKRQDVLFVITGGFHKDGITAMLKEKGVSYLTFSPKMNSKWESSAYWDLLKSAPNSPANLLAENSSLRQPREDYSTEAVITQIGALPFYEKETLAAAASLGFLPPTPDNIYEQVILAYQRELELSASDPKVQNNLRILKRILAEISSRRGKNEPIQLNNLEFDTKEGKLTVFVQRENPATQEFQPPIPADKNGLKSIKLPEQVDVNGVFAPQVGQRFKLTVLFQLNKPSVDSGVAAKTPSARTAAAKTSSGTVKAAGEKQKPKFPFRKGRKTASTSNAETGISPSDNVRKTSKPLFKVCLLVALCGGVGLCTITTIFRSLIALHKKSVDDRMAVIREKQREILDQIWAKDFDGAAKTLADVRQEHKRFALPTQAPRPDIIVTSDPSKPIDLPHFDELERLLILIRDFERLAQDKTPTSARQVGGFANKINQLKIGFSFIDETGEEQKIYCFSENDALLIYFYAVRGVLFQFKYDKWVPREKNDRQRFWLRYQIHEKEIGKDFITPVVIPDKMKKDFSETLTDFLERSRLLIGDDPETKKKLDMIAEKLASHSSYLKPSDSQLHDLRTELNKEESDRLFELWLAVLAHQIRDYDRPVNELVRGREIVEKYLYGMPRDNQANGHPKAFMTIVKETLQQILEEKKSRGEIIRIEQPLFLPAPGGGLAFYLQKRKGNEPWCPTIGNQSILDEFRVRRICCPMGEYEYRIVFTALESASSGKSLGIASGTLPPTPDNIYEQVILAYQRELELSASDPKVPNNLRILKRILAEISSRRRKNEPIQLNNLEFDTKEGKLTVFVQRENPATREFQPPIPADKNGLKSIKLPEQVDVNGAFAPQVGQRFKLTVLFQLNKPSERNAVAKTASATTAAAVTGKPKSPSPAQKVRKTASSEKAQAVVALLDTDKKPSRRFSKGCLLFALISAGCLVTGAISNIPTYLSKKRVEDRMSFIRQTQREILDQIWARDFDGARKSLQYVEDHPQYYSLPAPPMPPKPFDPSNPNPSISPHFDTYRRLIVLIHGGGFANFKPEFIMFTDETGAMQTLTCYTSNDSLLIQFLKIQAELFHLRHGKFHDTPQEYVERQKVWLKDASKIMLGIVSDAKIPDKMRNDFSKAVTEFLERASRISDLDSGTAKNVDFIAKKLPGHAYYQKPSDNELRVLQTEMNAVPLQLERAVIEKQELVKKQQSTELYDLWPKLAKHQTGRMLVGEEKEFKGRLMAEFLQDYEILKTRLSEIYKSVPDFSTPADTSHAFFIRILWALETALEAKSKNHDIITIEQPLVLSDRGGGLAFYLQKREDSGAWEPPIDSDKILGELRYTKDYYKNPYGVYEYRIVFTAPEPASSGKSLGENRRNLGPSVIQSPRFTPLVMKFDADVLEQLLDKQRDFRSDYRTQGVIFLVPDEEIARKVEDEFGSLLKDRHVYLVKWGNLERTTRLDLKALLSRIQTRIVDAMFPDGNVTELRPDQVVFLNHQFNESWPESAFRVVHQKNGLKKEAYRSALLRTVFDAFGNKSDWNYLFRHMDINSSTYELLPSILEEQIRLWQKTRILETAA